MAEVSEEEEEEVVLLLEWLMTPMPPLTWCRTLNKNVHSITTIDLKSIGRLRPSNIRLPSP